MQAGTNALEVVKETAANVVVSARSGLEKTKATLEEKGDKMTARSDADKEFAEHRKEERKAAAQLNKQRAYEQNAITRAAHTTHITPTPGGGGGGAHPGPDSASSTVGSGYTAGPAQMSARPSKTT